MNYKADTTFITVGSSRVCSHNVAPALPSGVLISGTPSVVDNDATGDLTISEVQSNSSSYTEEVTGETVGIGEAVQFKVSSSSSSAKSYTLKITYSTDGSPSETIIDWLVVSFVEV